MKAKIINFKTNEKCEMEVTFIRILCDGMEYRITDTGKNIAINSSKEIEVINKLPYFFLIGPKKEDKK